MSLRNRASPAPYPIALDAHLRQRAERRRVAGHDAARRSASRAPPRPRPRRSGTPCQQPQRSPAPAPETSPCAHCTVPLPTFSGDDDDRRRAKPLHAEHGADDVDDRVERADLVQVHLARPASHGSPPRPRPAARTGAPRDPCRRRQRRPPDAAGDLLQAVVSVVRRTACRARVGGPAVSRATRAMCRRTWRELVRMLVRAACEWPCVLRGWSCECSCACACACAQGRMHAGVRLFRVHVELRRRDAGPEHPLADTPPYRSPGCRAPRAARRAAARDRAAHRAPCRRTRRRNNRSTASCPRLRSVPSSLKLK